MSGFGWPLPVCLVTMMTMTAAAAETLKDVPFSHAGGADLRFDASIPDGAGPFPAAIIVHGGGWVRGDRRTDVTPLFKPLEDAGIAWFSIDYRLQADPLRFGVAVNDVEAAVRFVKDHAQEYRVDPERVALIGESAGGQLAAMAALNGRVSVKAVVAMYAPTDLVSLLKNSDLIPDQIRDQVRGTALEGLLVARMSQLSPIEKVHAGNAAVSVDPWDVRCDCAFRSIARDVREDGVGGSRLPVVCGAAGGAWNAALGRHAFDGGAV